MEEGKYIIIRCLHDGQVAAYKDSIYSYEIESDMSAGLVKHFCTRKLKKAEHEGTDFSGSCSFPFGLNPFYSFTKTGDNSYKYIVCQPYCD